MAKVDDFMVLALPRCAEMHRRCQEDYGQAGWQSGLAWSSNQDINQDGVIRTSRIRKESGRRGLAWRVQREGVAAVSKITDKDKGV